MSTNVFVERPLFWAPPSINQDKPAIPGNQPHRQRYVGTPAFDPDWFDLDRLSPGLGLPGGPDDQAAREALGPARFRSANPLPSAIAIDARRERHLGSRRSEERHGERRSARVAQAIVLSALLDPLRGIAQQIALVSSQKNGNPRAVFMILGATEMSNSQMITFFHVMRPHQIEADHKDVSLWVRQRSNT